MAEDDGLALAPVFVKDLNAVFGGDRAHWWDLLVRTARVKSGHRATARLDALSAATQDVRRTRRSSIRPSYWIAGQNRLVRPAWSPGVSHPKIDTIVQW